MTSERLEVQRTIAADPATIFRLLCDPQGHVAIDSSGMLMDATGEPVAAVGDSFVVHMDREALNDYPMGRYDVTVTITTFDPGPGDRLDDPRPDPPADRPRLRLHARAGRRGHPRHLVLRLVVDRPGLEGGRDLPGHLGRCAAGHAGHPRPHRGARVSPVARLSLGSAHGAAAAVLSSRNASAMRGSGQEALRPLGFGRTQRWAVPRRSGCGPMVALGRANAVR